jgi:hypothetical protein
MVSYPRNAKTKRDRPAHSVGEMREAVATVVLPCGAMIKPRDLMRPPRALGGTLLTRCGDFRAVGQMPLS